MVPNDEAVITFQILLDSFFINGGKRVAVGFKTEIYDTLKEIFSDL